MTIEIVEAGQADVCCTHVEHSDTPSKADRHWHRLQQYCSSVFDLAQFKPLDAAAFLNASSQEHYNQAAIKLINQYFCAVTHIKEDIHKLRATDRVEVTSHLPEEEDIWLKGDVNSEQHKLILARARKALAKARFAVDGDEVTLKDSDLTTLYRALDLWLGVQ